MGNNFRIFSLFEDVSIFFPSIGKSRILYWLEVLKKNKELPKLCSVLRAATFDRYVREKIKISPYRWIRSDKKMEGSNSTFSSNLTIATHLWRWNSSIFFPNNIIIIANKDFFKFFVELTIVAWNSWQIYSCIFLKFTPKKKLKIWSNIWFLNKMERLLTKHETKDKRERLRKSDWTPKKDTSFCVFSHLIS